MEKQYSNREIDEKNKDVFATLQRIEAQTTKTNGRVTKLERWMYGVAGAITILGFLIGAKLLTFIQ